MRRLTAAATAVLLASGCSGRSATAPGEPLPQLAGNWSVAVRVTGGTEFAAGTPYGAQFFLTQAAQQLGGNFNAGPGTYGTFLGTISGATVNFTLTQVSPCGATFRGTATVAASDSAMTGSYAGSDCGGTVSATFSASRE